MRATDKSDLEIDFGRNRHAGHKNDREDFDGKGNILGS